MSESLRGNCPRCGARIDLYKENDTSRKANRLRRATGADPVDGRRIRAHKDPAIGGSCWAGGMLYGEIEDLIAAHHDRLRAARISAGVEG